MCIAIPMKVVEPLGAASALCSSGERTETVATELTGPVRAGDWVLVFQGSAQRLMDEEEALQCRAALSALSAVMDGTASAQTVEDAFADITAHTGELPDFLKKQANGGPAA